MYCLSRCSHHAESRRYATLPAGDGVPLVPAAGQGDAESRCDLVSRCSKVATTQRADVILGYGAMPVSIY